MKIVYKIDGSTVERDTFNSMVNDMVLFNVWEKVIDEYKNEINGQNISIVYKLVNGRMHVLTDTQMLFKLNYHVRKELFNVLKLQSVMIYR